MVIEAHDRSVAVLYEEAPRPRGPMRPEQLVTVRKRQARRLASHRFRAIDSLLVVVLALFAAERMSGVPTLEMPLASAIPIALGVWTTWSLLRVMELYSFGRQEGLVGHSAGVVAAAVSGSAVAALTHWVLPAPETSAADAAAAVAICGAGLLVVHAFWWGQVARWRSRGLLTPNVVVVGATGAAEELVVRALDRRDMNIIGIFDDRLERSPRGIRGVPVLGTTDALLRHKLVPFVDLIVVAIDPSATTRVREITRRLSVLPNTTTLLVETPGTKRHAEAIEHLADGPLAPLRPAADPLRKAHAKRIQDLAIAVPVLLLAAPFLAIVALAIRLDSPGPIFFRQRRHGFNNEEIVVWKFRTMRHESADARAERQVTADDDRVTRVGRVLRMTGLDEVPQLFNVITCEMSLVGPRPHAIGMKTGDTESEQLVAEYAQRHRIKPGMTGWAAVNGSRGPLHTPEEVAERVALDIAYIERQTIWLDLLIMMKTVPSLLLGDRTTVR